MYTHKIFEDAGTEVAYLRFDGSMRASALPDTPQSCVSARCFFAHSNDADPLHLRRYPRRKHCGHTRVRRLRDNAATEKKTLTAGPTMIEGTTMRTPGHSEKPQFWSDAYCGRRIAVLNHYGRCYVYLDHVLQHNVVFSSHEDAVAWLLQRVDRSAPARAA